MKTIAKLKVRELKSELTKRNVEFAANDAKAVLIEVCTASFLQNLYFYQNTEAELSFFRLNFFEIDRNREFRT